MADVLETLIIASKRAAAVAKSCSVNDSKALLLAEKGEGEANARFERDFKTIADVLAQESAKNLIARRFPMLFEHVRGEECAEIGGVSIILKNCAQETAELLSSLVPLQQAKQMALAAHSDDNDVCDLELPKDLPEINIADLGVWIDPIDATAEFIAGVCGEAVGDECGLQCVTVLIGAYVRSTGEPVLGVINQPFYQNGNGRIVWGICYGGISKWSGNIENHLDPKIILMSGAETSEIKEKFKNAGWTIKSVPGAGYKLLKVALGEAAAYILSKGTTFRWDTCAPHAILRAQGGDIICYTTRSSITYNNPYDIATQEYANAGGIIAYNGDIMDKIKSILN